MDTKFEKFAGTIKTKHSFGFSPKYSEELEIEYKPRVFIEIAKTVIEKLDWQIIYESDSELVAARKNDFRSVTEKISFKTALHNPINIQSKSESGIWDMGRNSKRVKLFIYAYQEEMKIIDEEQITKLEELTTAKDNWDDYVVPDIIPKPKKYNEPVIIIPVIGILVLSVAFGFLISRLSVHGLYVIGLYELAVGLIFAYSFKIFLPLSNYADFRNLKTLLGVGILLTFFLNQYFQFQYFKEQYNDLTFSIFIKERLKYGLKIKELNVGTIGLIISWIFQLGFTYLISYLNTFRIVLVFSIERVPKEVIEFALYHFVKGKEERAVRSELGKKGWGKSIEQDMVFEAISAAQGGQEYNKIV